MPHDSTAIVTRMVDALAHRGPDGRGVAECDAVGPSRPLGTGQLGHRAPTVTFGHTRLAILDLSDRARQPMRSVRAPVWITYNGEIYNFQAIRRELEGRGHSFTSRSDTEVLLHGYEEWGEGVLERVQGMFALAIWDGVKGRLLLARDRLGIKPLYVYRGEGLLVFASEVRALLATGLVPRQLDVCGLEQYLTYQTAATPRTLVENVQMIEPGHWLSATATGEVAGRQYWDLLDCASPAASGASFADARTQVRELLAESAARHLVSDVPIGIFLSGGIDSSAIVALTQRAGAVPRTFAVVFPGTAHDEAPFARRVAARYGADHTEITLSDDDLREQLPEGLGSVDHPSGDGLNTFVVARAVRAAGFKVALSGLGGDELFGGYPSFRRLGRLARYATVWRRSPAPMRAVAAAAIRALGGSSVRSAKAAAVLETDGRVPQAFPVMRQLFSLADRRALIGRDLVERSQAGGDPYVALLERASARHPDVGVMSLVSYAEARTYMHDVLLRDTDQMTMAHGLEARVPLLDHHLAEYVCGLPDSVKAPGGMAKRLLVESLGTDLPEECVRRPKQGFVLPFDRWMKGDLRPFCERHLGPEGLAGRGVFRGPALQALWAAFLSSDRRTSWSRPWTLVALNAWLERNRIS